MISSLIDIPVYINFFNRPNTLKYVFDAVKEAKPSKLFLSCDGPREGKKADIDNIKKCKEIVENIDWDCEVYKNYSDENLGCGFRMYSGITWAFEHVDRLIVLEDDCVPCIDFFRFCKELLEKYKDDNRIYMINAMNHLGKYEKCPYSYFFGPGCCWGWATWSRAWKEMSFSLSFLDDLYALRCVESKNPYYHNAIDAGISRKKKLDSGERLTSWTYQFGMGGALNSQMAIVPSVNMITNIGLTADSTHAVSNLKKIAKSQQAYFNQPTYEMNFPLLHPKYVVEDIDYYDLVQKKFKLTFSRRLEGYIRRVVFAEPGDLTEIISKIIKKRKR